MHFPQIHGSPLSHAAGVTALPEGELANEVRLRGLGRCQTALHCDRIALTKSLPIAAPAPLSCRACPLRHCFAMPPLPKGEALAGCKAQKIPHGGRNSLGDFSLLEMKALGSHISAFIVCHSLQKSSTAQKVYKRPLRRFAPALPEGEPLAGRVTFHWTPEARYGVKGRALLTGTAASGQRSLSSCRWPGQRSTAASEILCFARPDESWPTCQWLPLWGSWRGAGRRD